MPSFTSRDGLEIGYRKIGAGAPVVLVHGWMMSGSVWDPITDLLIAAGHELIIPDQRGSGASAQPAHGYTLDHYAADLIALVDAAALDRFAIVGHSMGAQVTQVAASSFGDRVRSISLVCPVPVVGLTLPDPLVQLFRNCGGDPTAQTQILQMACNQLDPAKLALLLASAASVSTACVAEALDAWTLGGDAERLAAITCETFVIGTDDRFLPAELLRQSVVAPIANARFVALPGPGHYPQVEDPAATAALLCSLLADEAG